MPDTAGPNEIRYGTAGGTELARAPFAVIVAVRLEASPAVVAGASVSVSWMGPDNKDDIITIVPAGTPEKR